MVRLVHGHVKRQAADKSLFWLIPALAFDIAPIYSNDPTQA